MSEGISLSKQDEIDLMCAIDNLKLHYLIQTCAEITGKKGFNVGLHRSQLALMITELAEADENLSLSFNPELDRFMSTIQSLCTQFETYRCNTPAHEDTSQIIHTQLLLEELSDVCIRIFSYVGGNNLTDSFIKYLVEKIKKNAEREILHGKKF